MELDCVNRRDEKLLYVQLLFNTDTFDQYIPGIPTVIFKCKPPEK